MYGLLFFFFHRIRRHNYMLVDTLLHVLWMKFISIVNFIIKFFLFSSLSLTYPVSRYQNGRDTPQTTAKIAQLSIFLTTSYECSVNIAIDPSHKSNNVLDKYPTMHQYVTEMYTCVHISVTKWCILGYGTDVLWDLCNRSISSCDCSEHAFFHQSSYNLYQIDDFHSGVFMTSLTWRFSHHLPMKTGKSKSLPIFSPETNQELQSIKLFMHFIQWYSTSKWLPRVCSVVP